MTRPFLRSSVTVFKALCWTCGCLAAGQPEPVEVLALPEYSEGPVFDHQGNLFVSHGRSTVTKLSFDGKASVWFTVDRPNGHKVLPDGTHLLCARGGVLHLDAEANLFGRVDSCEGIPLRSPNDLTLDTRGGYYFTDPAGSWEQPVGTIHYVSREGAALLVAAGLSVPNGLVIGPRGQTLYVAETKPNRILRFDVQANGELGPMREFAKLPGGPGIDGPDGLALDENGNLYVAQLGAAAVHVLAPSGKRVRTLPAGNLDASNLVFGGPARNQLYVTGSIGKRYRSPGRVYRLTLTGVVGVSPLLRRVP